MLNHFAQSLRNWRKHRGYSQLDLSCLAEVSSRHISFLESGRASPSRNMVLKLGQVLAIPLREQNRLLQSAGFAAQFSGHGLDEEEMSALRSVLDLMLRNHQPYPAVAIDTCWNPVASNTPFKQLHQLLSQLPGWPHELNNTMELLFHPRAYRPLLRNWDEIASLFLQRLQREIQTTRDIRQEQLWQTIHSSYPLPAGWQAPLEHQHKPYIHATLCWQGMTLNLLSTITVFGTATDITAQELRIEHFYPLDQSTRQFFQQLAARDRRQENKQAATDKVSIDY